MVSRLCRAERNLRLNKKEYGELSGFKERKNMCLSQSPSMLLRGEAAPLSGQRKAHS